MKKIAVLGNGQLGKTYKELYPDVVIIGSSKLLNHPKSMDDSSSLWINFHYLESFDVIINTIAVTNTKQCEDEKFIDYIGAVNTSMPSYLSNYCHNRRKKFVQISTACVYKETDLPCNEDSEKKPSNRYASSKWQGELGLMQKNDIVLRGHLFFSNQNLPSNFLHRIKNFSTFIEELNSLTFVNDIVGATMALLEKEITGTFNISCDGIASPFEIAKHLKLPEITKISSEELRQKTNLVIPNIIMDNSKISEHYPVSNLFESINQCWNSLHAF